MVDLGFLSLEERDDIQGVSYRSLMAQIAGGNDPEKAEETVAKRLGIKVESDPIKRWTWLGLFSEDKTPDEPTLLDVLSHRLLEKLQYSAKERDMIVLHHEFISEYEDGKKKTTSTLVDFGDPAGDSSMSRTVSLPAAIGTRLILEGKIQATGVHIPVEKQIYSPVLKELEELGIECREVETVLD